MSRLSLVKTLGILSLLLLLVSCGGKQSQPEQEQAEAPPVEKLDKRYDTLLFAPFTITPELAKDDPQAST